MPDAPGNQPAPAEPAPTQQPTQTNQPQNQPQTVTLESSKLTSILDRLDHLDKTNKDLSAELAKLKQPDQAPPGNHQPDPATNPKPQPKGKGKGAASSEEDIQAQIEEALQGFREESKATIEGLQAKLQEGEQASKDLQDQLMRAHLESAIMKGVTNYAQVKPNAMKYILIDALEDFKMVDGKLIPYKDGKPRRSAKDPVQYMAPEEWVAEHFQANKSTFYEPAKGGGSSGSQGGPTGSNEIRYNDPNIENHIEDIAKGNLRVVAGGN